MKYLQRILASLASAFFVIAVLSVANLASAAPVRKGHASAELISERAAIAPGDSFQVALKLDLDPGGWHVYWRNPGDSGLPPEIKWELPEGVSAGEFVWPAPHAIPVPPLTNYGYQKQLVLPVDFKVSDAVHVGDKLTLHGKADWLICLDTCVPEKADLVLVLSVEASPRADAIGGAAIASAISAAPRPLAGSAVSTRTDKGFGLGVVGAEIVAAAKTARSLRFFPFNQEIDYNAGQSARRGSAGVSLSLAASPLAPKGSAPLAGVLVAEQSDGARKAWTINSKPAAALPSGVTAEALGENAMSLSALLAALGAAFLGGLILNLMPCVLPVLSVKAAGLLQTAHNAREARGHGIAYFIGVVVCFAAIGAILAALRAAGDQSGLGFQLQYPAVVALFALLMFAIGLNMLGVFEMGTSLVGVGGGLADRGGWSGAFFTGVLAAFVGAPCVGPLMAPAVGVALTQPPAIILLVFVVIGAGLAAPMTLLSFTPALARVLPKPGKWMIAFRQILAFPMFLTALWLLWVLAGQAGSDGVMLTLMGAILFAFGIWVAKTYGRGNAGKAAAAIVLLAALIGPAAGTWALGASTQPASSPQLVAAEEAWSPERVEALRANKRPIFVDFTARWCATCQVNRRLAIDTSEVQEAFKKNNVAFLVADWTNRDAVIASELAAHDRAGVPLYLMYPADGGPPEVLPQLLSAGLIVRAVETSTHASKGVRQ